MIFRRGGAEKIELVDAGEILDSRGRPTIAVTVATKNHSACAAVPSGVSTGKHEALELRDGDASRFDGLGVKKAVDAVKKTIAPAIKGMNPHNQGEIDAALIKLDGTPNKSKLGANAILGVSLATSRLAAKISKLPLYQYLKKLADIRPSRKVPYLYANLINGGKHAATPLPFQEYHAVPQTEDFEEAINIIYKIQNELKKTLQANIGDEGGFVPNISDVEEPLKILKQAAEKTGTATKVKFAMDVAASAGELKWGPAELLSLYEKMAANYPLLSIEDPFGEEDFENFAKLRKSIYAYVVGDDLTATNKTRLQTAIDKNSINGIIIKPNQVGTLSETLETMKLARENNIECIVSHRSGETNDDFIADLATAFGVFGIKAGALQRGERITKYNRLWHILGHK